MALCAVPVLRQRSVFVDRCLVIAGMASRAGPGISWMAIADSFIVLLVARQADQVDRVVARVVAGNRMGITGGRPSRRGMAKITILGSHEMAQRIAWCKATVVAGQAVIGDALVVHRATGKSRRGVTEMAIERGRQVRIRFSRRRGAMTGSAAVHNAGMVEQCADKADRIMACATILYCCDVSVGLADGKTGVMAGCTVFDNAAVIEAGRQEARGLVADMTILVRGYVAWRRGFPRCGDAVVAGDAIVDDAAMVVLCTGEGRGVMTQGAVIAWPNRNMWCRQSAGVGFVMAGCAVIHDALVIEHRGQKRAAGGMADPAVFANRYMRRIDLCVGASSVDAVVAGVAAIRGYRQSAMIDVGIDKGRRVMADRAILAGVLMDPRIGCADGPGGDMIRDAVVTGNAVRRDALVAEYRRNESAHRMAILAVLVGRQMACRLDLQHGRQECFDVATLAALGQALMDRGTESRRGKRSDGIVALAAFAQGRNMVDRLGWRNARVMAQRTVARIDALVAIEHTGKTAIPRVTDRAILVKAGNMPEWQTGTDIAVMA